MIRLRREDWATIAAALDVMADWYWEYDYAIYADTDEAPARLMRFRDRLKRIRDIQTKIGRKGQRAYKFGVGRQLDGPNSGPPSSPTALFAPAGRRVLR